MAKTKVKGPRQKQRANVYMMMLIIAFLALVVGSVMLYLQMNRYSGSDGKWQREAPTNLQKGVWMAPKHEISQMRFA